ncbi:uncharacterized protein LOC100368853 [Saccoglossus kowalevskii]|uniref:Mitochondria-eating protein n=1 Tax=Saccoglossus kowalevskii TaxID=10224 RepID=A0ABM0GZ94_SACKO|nr:PREDICTED: uncharacterized protein LOC100368853 [Saccoglossus kowalevskii]
MFDVTMATTGAYDADVEDISNVNRPGKVIDEYKYFIDGGRMTFIEQLENVVSPLEACCIAVEIFQDAYNLANKALEDYHSRMAIVIDNPVRRKTKSISRRSSIFASTKRKKDVAVTNTVRVPEMNYFIERRAHVENIEDILEEVMNEFKKKQKKIYKKINKKKHEDVRSCLSEYIRQCCRLSWEMVVLTPPLEIDLKSGIGKKHNPLRHEVYIDYTRGPKKNGHDGVIEKYLWPIMSQSQSDKKLVCCVKGIVLLK